MAKVSAIMAHLANLNPDLEVGVIGHCSEFYELAPEDIMVQNANCQHIDEYGHLSLVTEAVVSLRVPDLGVPDKSL